MIGPEITAPPAQQPAPAPLTPREPMILLGFRCMQRKLASLSARSPRGGAAPSVNDTHQMRIAIRRLRIALRLFGHMLPNNEAAEISAELRWLASGLGAVRDLDVHIGELRDHVRGVAPEHARELGGYELELRRQLTAARAALREIFASDRYRTLMTTLDRLLGQGPSPAALRRFRSFRIRDGAATHLARSRKRVLKLGRKLGAESSADDLHRLRIRAKRLRYELEFFLEPYPELGAAIAAVKGLQDVLGADRDALLGAARVADYRRRLRGRRRDGAPPAAALGDWETRQTAAGRTTRQRFPEAWETLVRALHKSAFKAL